jgi:signal peptide peptidase SppA
MIVLDVDSPGGEAAGNFELCREIMEARETKPILAVVDSVAASGGYSIIACCTRSYAIPSARIGSIGVYRMHIDISKMMEAEGVKITFAKAGDHKTDGNPYEPLSDSVKKEWEEAAGKTWDDFIAVVAEGRGLSPAEVRNTQARVYRADEALALGLIDAVKTTSEAVAAFVAELAEDEPFYEEDQMAEKSTLQSKPEVASGAPAAAPQVSADAIAAAITAHETQKRERRTAIRSLDGAKDHPALVQSLIEDTDLPVDAVKLLIQAADEDKPEPAPADESEDDEDEDGEQDGDDDTDESAAAGDMKKKKAKKGQKASSLDNQNHFASAMGNSDQPNVGAGREQRQQRADGDKSPADMASGILAAQAKITGREVKTTA